MVDNKSQICYNNGLKRNKEFCMKVGQSYTTKMGGTVTITKTGLVHRAGAGAYSGRLAETNTNVVAYDTPKRGRGRPRKNA